MNRRGQLILTAAILIALTIVASAVLLNSIHASADVTAQQERQSLAETERNIEQIQDNLAELFVVNGSEERMPYVESGKEDKFKAAVEEYSDQYLNMSTRHGAAFVDVEFRESASETGHVFVQNGTRNFTSDPDSGVLEITGGTDLTYLYFNVTSLDDSNNLTIQVNGSDEITIEDTEGQTVVERSDTVCTVGSVDKESPLEIEVFDGEGVVRYDGTVCGNIEFGTDFGDHGQLNINGADSEGTFIVSIEGDTTVWDSPSSERYKHSGITNPMFRITYQDPQVTYETNVTAYGGGS